LATCLRRYLQPALAVKRRKSNSRLRSVSITVASGLTRDEEFAGGSSHTNGEFKTHKMMQTAIVALAILQLGAAQSLAQDGPFVAGFERFYRHRDSGGGRLLIAELSCTACHASRLESLQAKKGPNLDGAALRLRRGWIERFLDDPAGVKPGTAMPDVLGALPADDKREAIRALAAFLATQKRPFPVFESTGRDPIAHEFWRKGDAERGRQLYHQVGCIACHEPDDDYAAVEQQPSTVAKLLAQLDPEELEEMGLGDAARPVASIPHADLPMKYTHESLTHFLIDPTAVRPGGRMPSLKLAPAEAADIAAWLLRNRPDVSRVHGETSESLVETGRRLFDELRCSSCHAAKGATPPKPARRLAELDPNARRSCFKGRQRGLPHFKLDEQQRRAIESTLAVVRNSGSVEVSANAKVDFRMQQLNCYGCHVRDGRGGVGPNRRNYFEVSGHVDLGDEGRIPPPLDGVGRKLTADWMKKVLGGSGDVRPHMLARMPRFAATVVESLPGQLADADEQPSPADVLGDTRSLAEQGRLLLDVGCVQCHPVRGEHLPGVVGIDLQGIAGRVDPRWFRDFLLNPADLKPRTRMPTFFPDGKSGNQEILGGDAGQQIAAMWEYIKGADQLPLPDKIEQGRVHNFELVPNDRPLLLRTFMQAAGTHAIAVGFPQKVHLAFDAEAVRVAQVWRGRFLDAHGTWFDRFIPPASPLGTDVIEMQPGVPFANLNDDKAEWPTATGESAGYQFSGYRLDKSGTPTFLYRFGVVSIEDRFAPAADRTLIRRLRLSNGEKDQAGPGKIWFRAIAGDALRRNGLGSYTSQDGITVTLTQGRLLDGTLRTINKVSDWIIPVDVAAETDIELRYEW